MKNTENRPAPPESLQALRERYRQVQNGLIDLGLSPKMCKVLERLLAEPSRVISASITELAQWTETSPATLSRLSRKLGFRDFQQFHRCFDSAQRAPSRYYSDKVSQGIASESEAASERLRQHTENLHRVDQLNASEKLERVAKQVVAARRVAVFGRRQSYSLAVALAYMLGLIREQVSVVGSAGEGQAQTLSDLNATDLLILFSSQPYSQDTVVMAQVAKKLRIPMLAITDSPQSPLAALASQTLIAPSETMFFTNSLVPTQYLMERLLSKIAARLGAQVKPRLEQRELIISQLNDEY